MSLGAIAGRSSADFTRGDRIDVMDASGERIGWVDPRTGVRNLLAPGRRVEFDQMIDYWLSAAGLSDPGALDNAQDSLAAPWSVPSDNSDAMHVTEVRYPDAEVVRSLLIPLLPLS